MGRLINGVSTDVAEVIKDLTGEGVDTLETLEDAALAILEQKAAIEKLNNQPHPFLLMGA